MKGILIVAVLGIATLASLVGCGGTTTTSVKPVPTTMMRAKPAPDALLQAIASGEKEGVGMVPVRGMVVRSDDYKKAYFVAMEFSATDIDNQVGVWVTDAIDDPSMILAVDGTAKEFAVWPAGGKTDPEFSMTSDGAEEAKAALSE